MITQQDTAPVAGCGEPAGEGEYCVPSSAVTFTVPNPPSVNAMFKNLPGRGRAKTSAYRDWQMIAKSAIRQQRVEGIDGHVVVVIGLERPNEVSDLDNRAKAILDILNQKHGMGLIKDDRFVTGLLLSWLPKANGLAHVQILPVQHVTANFHPASNGASGAWMIEAPFQHGDHCGN